MTDPRDLIPMPPDFRERVAFHRDRVRRLARQSPCPVCEVPSDEPCDPKNPTALTPGGMHWARYPKNQERIEGKNG